MAAGSPGNLSGLQACSPPANLYNSTNSSSGQSPPQQLANMSGGVLDMTPPRFAESPSSTDQGASPQQQMNASREGLSGVGPPSLASSPASCGRAQLASPQNNNTNRNLSGFSAANSPNSPCCQSLPGNARMTSSPGGLQNTSPPPFANTSGSSAGGNAPSCCMNSTGGSEALHVSIPNASAVIAEMSNLTDTESCFATPPPRPRTPLPSPFNRQPTPPPSNLPRQSPPFDPAAYRCGVPSGGQVAPQPQGGYNATEESYGLLNRDITLEGTFEQMMTNDPNIPAYHFHKDPFFVRQRELIQQHYDNPQTRNRTLNLEAEFGEEGREIMDRNWNYWLQPGFVGFPLNVPDRQRCPTPPPGNDPYFAQSTPRPMPDRYRQPAGRYVNASPIGPPTPPGRPNYSGYSFLNDSSLLQGANISDWEDPARLQNHANLSRNIPLTYSPPPRPEPFPAEYIMETPPPGAPRPYNVQFSPNTAASPDMRLGSFFRTPSPQRPQSAPCARVPTPTPMAPEGYPPRMYSPPANLNSPVGASPSPQQANSSGGSGGVLGMSSPSFAGSPSSTGQGASPQQQANASGGGLADVTPPDFGSSSSASSGSPQQPANVSGCGVANTTPPNFESSSASSGSPQQPLNVSGGGLADTTPPNFASSSANSGSPESQQPGNISGGGLANTSPPNFSSSSASSGSPQQRLNVSGGGLANVTPPDFGSSSSASSGSPQQPPQNVMGTGGTPGDSSGTSNSRTYTFVPNDTIGSEMSREVFRADRSGANSVPCSPAVAYANRMQSGLPRASPGGGGPGNGNSYGAAGPGNSPRAVGPGGPGGRASSIGSSIPPGALIPSPARERSSVNERSNASNAPQGRANGPSALEILSSCFELILQRLMLGNMIPVVNDLMRMGVWPWRFCNCPAPQSQLSSLMASQARSNVMAPQARGSSILAAQPGLSNIMSPQAGANNAVAVGAPAAQSTPRGPIVLRPNHDQGYRGDFSFLDNASMPPFEFFPESQILLQQQLQGSPVNAASPRPCNLPPEQSSMGGPGQLSQLSPPGPMHRSMINAEGMNSSQQRPCCGSAARSQMSGAAQSFNLSRALVPVNQVNPAGMNMLQGNQSYLRQGVSPAPLQAPVSPPGACSQNNQRQNAADLSISGWSSFNRTGNPSNPDFDSTSYY